MIHDKNASVTMRRQEFSLSRERLKLASTPAMQEVRFNDEVVVVDADDTTDKNEEAKKRLLVATRNVLFMPNSLMKAEMILHSHLRELITVIGSISQDNPLEEMNDMWTMLLNILSMMKTNGETETRNDPEFKLITIDLLTHYVNYKARVTETEIFCRFITADELERKREDLYMKIFLLLDNAIEDILMLLMSLDVQKKFDGMLYPLFKNILTNSKFHKKMDIIMYVRRILCFRKWTKLTPLREEREKIYEYADKIIPRIMPKATPDTRSFSEILPPVSTKSKKHMTRFLLKSKYVNDQKLVEEFFRLWKQRLSGHDVGNMNFFSDIISALPEVEEADLQSTFFEGKIIQQNTPTTSTGANRLSSKSQGIVLGSKQNGLVDGKGISKSSELIDSTPQAPVINLCDSEDEVENPPPIVEILDSDDEVAPSKMNNPEEKTPDVPTELNKSVPSDRKENESSNVAAKEIKRRRVPKRRGIIVSRRRIFRREKILKRKSNSKGRKRISEGSSEPESSSDGSRQRQPKPCISVDLVSSTIVEQSPYNRTPSPNSVTSSNNYPASSSKNEDTVTSFSFFVEQLENEAKVSEKQNVNESRGSTSDGKSSEMTAEPSSGKERPESSENLIGEIFNPPEIEDLNEICSNVSDTPLDDDFLEQPHETLAEAISENELPESGKSSRTATPVLDEKPEDEDTRCLDEQPLGSKYERVIFSTSFKGHLFAEKLEECAPVAVFISDTIKDTEEKEVEIDKVECENNKNLSNSHELNDNDVLPNDKRCEEKPIETKDSKEERDDGKILIQNPEDGEKCVQQNLDDKISVDSGISVENKCTDALNEPVQDSIAQELEEEYPEGGREIAIEQTCQEDNEEKSPESNEAPEPTLEAHIETKENETDMLVSEIEPCDKNDCAEEISKDLPNKEDEENCVANNSTREEETEITKVIEIEDISQDEDDIPLMNLSSEKEENFREKKLHRRLKHKPVGTYCEDSIILYDGIRPCGIFTEDLPEEVQPKIIETQQDFMELMDLMPREKVSEMTEEVIENEKVVQIMDETTVAENNKKEDFPNTAEIYESEESITNLPIQCENIQPLDKGINQTTETPQIPFRSSILEAPVLNVLLPESIFPVNNSTVFDASERKIERHRKSLKARKKLSGKKIKKKRRKCLENNIIKTPFLKSALKSPSTPPSPKKRRVSFNPEISVVVPEDFTKSSDDSSCSHRRKSKESKKKRKNKECSTDDEKNELDVELQTRFSQCLSIVDLPNEKEAVEEIEQHLDSNVETNEIERITSEASEDENDLESEETNTLEKDEINQEDADKMEELPEIKEFDEYEEVSGEISTPEGADFMNEEDEDDADSLDNVEVIPNVIDEKKETDEEEFADEPQHPIEFSEISENYFVSSSDDEAEDVLEDPIANLRNKLIIKQVEVKLKKIVDSKKFCKRLGLKYISPDRQSHSHVEPKRKKSKKCKHKHKKRRKARKEPREMLIENEITEEEDEEVKDEGKRMENEATEEEICEMSPPENATTDSGINLVTPVLEKSPGTLKLKVRPQEELLTPEMKQIQQEEHVELDCDQRLDLFLLTDETNSNIKNFERWNDYLRKIYGDDTKMEAAKSKTDMKTEAVKSKDVTTPYTEESAGVDLLECLVLNDGMGSTMPIDVPRKDGSIEIWKVPEQLVNPSEILAPKKSTPEPPVECTNFYDSGSVKNISGESFGETSHTQSSNTYVTMLSFDDIMECEEPTSHEETVSYDESCEVVSQSYLTPLSSQHDHDFATINKKDLADIKSVSIPPAYDILQNSALAETEKDPVPDRSCDGSNESLSSWNSISLEIDDTANKVVATEAESSCLMDSKKCQEKTVKQKNKGDKVMTKAQQKETPEFCLPIKCNERIPVSKHILMKSRSTSTYTTSKTTISRGSPSPLPQTVSSTRESKEKTPQSLFDMPQLGHESPEEAKTSNGNSMETPKKSSDELFDQLKELYTPTSITRKRSCSVSDTEVTSPVEAQPKPSAEIPCQPPSAKIAKIYPHVVEKNNLSGRKPGQQPFKRDPFKNPKISSSTTSAEAKSRDSIVKELGVPATVDDATLHAKILKKLSELDSRPTPTSYKEHKELKEKKESLKKHLEILSAKLKHSSSRSVSSRPVALVSPSSSNNRARTMVAMASSSSFDRFRSDVASSSTSSTPTKVRPQASERQPSTSRRQPESWKPENIPTETIIEEYQQKAREKQEPKNKPSKRHHYAFI